MEKEKNKDLKNMLIGFGVIFLYLVGSALTHSFIGWFGISYYSLNKIGRAIYLIFYEAFLTLYS